MSDDILGGDDDDLVVDLDAHLKRMEEDQEVFAAAFRERAKLASEGGVTALPAIGHWIGGSDEDEQGDGAMNYSAVGELVGQNLRFRARKRQNREDAKNKARWGAEAFKAWAKTRPDFDPDVVREIVRRLKAGLPPVAPK